ncbi:hypothetical protein L7F22_007140 [Adiantum nelumboides]|nr:hypothetical protein [Adiantum nelumboides]
MSMADSAEVNFWGDIPENAYYRSQGVVNKKDYFTTPYGKLFTQSWLPSSGAVKGVVCCTHGYGSDSNWMFQKIPIAFAQWGYAAFASDMLGHGRSEGLHGYVEDIEKLVSASLHFFMSVRDSDTYAGLPKFLFGESMGGGATLLMMLQDQRGWDGAMFSAPLFEIPEPMKPSRLRLFGYGLLFGLAEPWAVMPDSNMVKRAVKDPAKGKVIGSNPRRYRGPPRVGTMRQLSRMCDIIQKRCDEIEIPILMLHGTSDDLAAHEGSQMVYEKAQSTDKTIKLYDGMYHSLIQGESDENISRVLADLREWIDERASKKACSN